MNAEAKDEMKSLLAKKKMLKLKLKIWIRAILRTQILEMKNIVNKLFSLRQN
jgi:hypothetical protein